MILNPYLAEFIGTTTLLLFGAGVVANVNLKKTLGFLDFGISEIDPFRIRPS